MQTMRNKRTAGAMALLLTASIALGACQTTGPKEGLGGIGGAVLGGLAGSQVGSGSGRLWATGAGAVLGALVGSSIGRSLDDVDRLKMEQTTQATLEHVADHNTSTWTNPNTQHSGTITPVQTYQADSGQYCREFTQTVTIGGRTEEAYGTACRQPDGTWKIQNS